MNPIVLVTFAISIRTGLSSVRIVRKNGDGFSIYDKPEPAYRILRKVAKNFRHRETTIISPNFVYIDLVR